MKKQVIAVLFGGNSTEYGVSLQSAAAVITHLNKQKYQPLLIGITRAGEWLHYLGSVEDIAADRWWKNQADLRQLLILPKPGERQLIELHEGEMRSLAVDAAFPVLHGKNGEDGTVQGLLELLGIPIIGCGTLASALCMDKHRAHLLVERAGVRVPQARALNERSSAADIQAFARCLGYPLFVKPVRSGSSLGITRVSSDDELLPAVKLAFEHDSQVIMEEAIPGFEVGCAVLGNDQLLTGQVDEIELSQGFFDFTEKYTLKTSSIHMPARIDAALAEQVQRIAAHIYRTLGCHGFARVDMFLTPDMQIVFNEVNTIPGFTPHSRFPKMMQGIGLEFPQLLEKLIETGVPK